MVAYPEEHRNLGYVPGSDGVEEKSWHERAADIQVRRETACEEGARRNSAQAGSKFIRIGAAQLHSERDATEQLLLVGNHESSRCRLYRSSVSGRRRCTLAALKDGLVEEFLLERSGKGYANQLAAR